MTQTVSGGSFSDLFASAEAVLKVIAGAGVVAAVFGLPAVSLQYARLGLPGVLIGYEEVLRAGVLPTAALGLMLLTSRLLRDFSALSAAGLLVFFALAGGALAIGLFVLAGYLLGVAWIAAQVLAAINEAFSLGVSEQLIVLASTGFILAAIGIGAARSFTAASRSLRQARERRRAARDVARDNAADAKPEDSPSDTTTSSKMNTWQVGTTIVGFALLTFASTYSLGWFLAGLGWSADVGTVDRGDRIFLSVLAPLALVSVFGSVVSAEAEDNRTVGWRRLGPPINAALFFAVLVWFYTVSLYPALSPAFGGGRPVPVTVWLKADAVPKNAVEALPDGGCLDLGAFLRCDRVWTFRTDKDIALLIAPPIGRAIRSIAVRRDAVTVLARRDARAAP